MPGSLLTTTIRDEVETIPRRSMEKLQLDRLRAGVERLTANGGGSGLGWQHEASAYDHA